MSEMAWGVFGTVLSTILTTTILVMARSLNKFISEQRVVNERNSVFMRSMQRAEIQRYFRMVVENGEEVTPAELSHLESCYQAYHDNGGNGVGTLMYERVMEHSKMVTK